MAVRDCVSSLQWPVHDIGANVEHGCSLVVLTQEFVERVVGTVGAVIETHPVTSWFGNVDDVGGNVAALGLGA